MSAQLNHYQPATRSGNPFIIFDDSMTVESVLVDEGSGFTPAMTLDNGKTWTWDAPRVDVPEITVVFNP